MYYTYTAGGGFISPSGLSNGSSPITIIAAPPPRAGDSYIVTPGKGDEGLPDGEIIFNSADGTEILKLGNDKSISIFGIKFSQEQIKDALKSFTSEKCSCNLNTIITDGCQCGGS